jgi:NAD(P)-dependent dehydrogenase (short-subunit alcohol dehydrogenase family)
MEVDHREEKIAVVTGGANGIGRGIALRLARDGIAVGILDCDAEACYRVQSEILECGGRGMALAADVGSNAATADAIEKLATHLGPPNLAVHSAAVMPSGTILETTEMEWDKAHSVNVRGAFLLCKSILPYMLRLKKGSIVFISSITGVNGLPGLAAYSSTKGALLALARAMAIDYARDGIRVNSVAPGTIDSPMLHAFVATQSDPEATRKRFDEVQPRGRVGTIAEVANVVAFLLSDESSFISGATICVDGGMSVRSEQPRN